MKSSRPLLLVLAATLLAGSSLPAHAANVLLHKRTSSATAALPLDSTTWTITTNASGALASRDTLVAQGGTINSDTFTPGVFADTTSDRGALLGAGKSLPHNLWLTVEVTGALQSIDTLYCFTQLSQGQVVGATAGGTGQTNTFTPSSIGDPNSVPFNWRWYDALGSSASLTGGLAALVNNTSTKTFIFPIPCAASDPNSWLTASNLRFVLVGDNNSAAVGFSTRAWLEWR